MKQQPGAMLTELSFNRISDAINIGNTKVMTNIESNIYIQVERLPKTNIYPEQKMITKKNELKKSGNGLYI